MSVKLTLSLNIRPKILFSYFFFQCYNLFSKAQCICMSHIFFYTNWIDLPIMTIHVHVKYDGIIS